MAHSDHGLLASPASAPSVTPGTAASYKTCEDEMILIDQAAGTTRTPDEAISTPRGRPTVIILERDGSLHHFPPDRPDSGGRQARIDIQDHQAEPNMLDRILDFTFDVLGLNKLEVRVHEQPER